MHRLTATMKQLVAPLNQRVAPLNQRFANVDGVYSPQAGADHHVTHHQRFVERLTATLGRPVTLYTVLLIALSWIGVNLALRGLGWPAPDPAPFPLLQGLATLSALVLGTTILITQNRQLKLSEKRSRLDLEINLTSERKIAKLIKLVEELRRDLPNVHNRTDAEADVMQERADPHAIAEELERRLQEEGSDQGVEAVPPLLSS